MKSKTFNVQNGRVEPLTLTEKQASEKFNINQNSLRLSRQTGLLWGQTAPKFLKIGSRIRYRPEDLEAWFDQFEAVGNTSEALRGAK